MPKEVDVKLIRSALEEAIWFVRVGGMPHEAIKLETELQAAIGRLNSLTKK